MPSYLCDPDVALQVAQVEIDAAASNPEPEPVKGSRGVIEANHDVRGSARHRNGDDARHPAFFPRQVVDDSAISRPLGEGPSIG